MDDGTFRPAGWFRSHPPARRLKWANILPLFEGVKPYPFEYERGCQFVIRSGNTRAAALRAAGMLKYAILECGESGRWVPVTDYIRMSKASWDDDDMSKYASPHMVDYVNKVFDVVVLDGLGEEKTTEWTKAEMATLIKDRAERALTTIVTTSLTPPQVTNLYGARPSSYLFDGQEIKVAG